MSSLAPPSGEPPAGQVPAAAPSEPALGVPNKEERFTALLVWGLDVFFQILGPYLMWRLQAPDSAFVTHHAKACINHGLTVLALIAVDVLVVGALGVVYLVAPVPETETGVALYLNAFWVVVGVAGAILAALLVVTLVVHVIALFKAWWGVWFVPPLCWRFVK